MTMNLKYVIRGHSRFIAGKPGLAPEAPFKVR
jgi:hypothetical protein